MLNGSRPRREARMPLATRDTRALRALLDTSFKEFVTPSLVRFLYVLALGGLAVVDLWFVIGALASSLLWGLATLLLVTLLTALAALWIRVSLETVVILFRIADHTAEAAEHGASIALNTASQPTRV